ncbi:hypothetical protein FPZ12_028020 [Amycolatopsis acidicola]|uniref:Uncharacterized protein n=2 Tax=Amycolatopsis acidicola TaxID=2596893 RepID=A0A5N0UVC3_9PSEU|nr:hypothetical protein FPZ12_028020 [Amycolatopsis acidicola]
MDEHRLRDKADAQKLLRQEKQHQQHSSQVREAGDVAKPTGAGSAELVGEDDGRIELDPAEITAADAELGRRYDELNELLTQAKELESPLRDGNSPVAAHLRKAFGMRGSADTGVQATLRDYLDELDALRQAIRNAGAGHAENEADIQATLAGLHDDGEA